MNRAARRRRDREWNPSATPRDAHADQSGNMSRVRKAKGRTVTFEREADFAVFDKLPKAIRAFLNDSLGRYGATQLREMWDQRRGEGWTVHRFVANAHRLDRETYRRVP